MDKLIILLLILSSSIFGTENFNKVPKFNTPKKSIGEKIKNTINVNVILKKGGIAYDSLKYKEALSYFLKGESNLQKKGNNNSKLLLNIGTTYYKLDSLSKAILYYEKSYKLNPYDISTSNNLSLLYTKIMGEDIVESDTIYTLYKFFNPIISQILYAIIFIILLMNFIYILIKKLKNKSMNKTYLITNLVIIIFISIYFFVNSFYITNFKYGILNNDTSFYSEPINGRVIGNLYKGHKIRIIKRDENMVFFNYKNKITGWVDNTNLLLMD